MTDENKPSDENQDQDLEKALPTTSLVPRENLILTAVHFLKNPKVQSSPTSQKTLFLQKKGLTDEEIKIALDRCSIDTKANSSHLPAYVPNNQLVPVPPAIITRPPSFWSQINRVGSSMIIIGIALYGINRFYKLYIEPWLFGKEAKESRFSLMEQQLLEMNRSLSQLKRNVSSVEESINSQKQQVDKIFQNEVNEYYPTPLMLNDLKAEVLSIKSLLLSRHQFPAAPKVGPSIPIWQMSVAKSENDSDQIEKTKLAENTDSTSETVINGDLNASVKETGVKVSEMLVDRDNDKVDQNEHLDKTDEEVSESNCFVNEKVVTEIAESLQAS